MAGVSPPPATLFLTDSHMPKITALQKQTGRIEELIHKLETSADPETLAIARELVQSLMELYGAGFERIADMIAGKGESGRQLLNELSHDELVGSLLAADGLHPTDLETRVRETVEKLHDRLHAQGAVELVSIEEGVIRLRLHPAGSGCKSTAGALQSAVEEALYQAAPDLVRLAIELVDEGAASSFVPLEKLGGYAARLAGTVNGNGAGL